MVKTQNNDKLYLNDEHFWDNFIKDGGYNTYSESVVVSNMKANRYIYLKFKRLFDIVISVLGLVIFSPILLITAIAIKLETKGTVMYTHNRIGLNGKLFRFYKFRSMVMNADDILYEKLLKNEQIAMEYKTNKKLKHDPRITKVGSFIRRTSIDELPQLLNVLKGDMSLIGNRPYMPRERDDMGEYYDDIVKTKPGMTGYWQVSGRSNHSFEKRLQMEKEYSEIFSFTMDLKIFFKTFMVIFNHEGGAR